MSSPNCCLRFSVFVPETLLFEWQCYTGWPQHRENREFGSYFFQTGKTQGILFWHREKFANTGKIFGLWLLTWKVCLFFLSSKMFCLPSFSIILSCTSAKAEHSLSSLSCVCVCVDQNKGTPPSQDFMGPYQNHYFCMTADLTWPKRPPS